MTIPVTLNTVGNLQDTTTAQTVLNANNALVEGGFSTAFNVTGDQMLGNLDMNSNQILNLPSPATINSPVRLQDVVSSTSVVSISSVPPVGTSGSVVGLLNANKTDSGSNTFTGHNTFSGTGSYTGVNSFSGTTNLSGSSFFSGPFTSSGSGSFSGVNSFASDVYFKDGFPWADVKAWGAVGDGSTDDTTAVQNAINFIYASSRNGGVVYFPPGQYYTPTGWTITGGTIRLVGAGIGSTILNVKANDVAVLTYNAACAYCSFEHMSIYGNNLSGTTNPAATAFAVVIGNNALVNSISALVWFGNFCLSNNGTDGCCFNTYFGNGFSGNVSTQGSNWYDRCKIDTSGVTTAASNYGLVINQSYTSAITENRFTMCDFSGPFTNNIIIQDSTNAAIANFLGCVAGNISITGSRWVSFSDCTLAGTIANSTTTGILNITNSYANGSTITVSGTNVNLSNNYNIFPTAYTATTLTNSFPSPATGARAVITDATSTTFGAGVTGGSTLVTPVYYTGSAWKIG